MIVNSKENLHWYALGALAWLAFVAFILTGLFTTIREAPFIAIPFFGVFLWIAWKAGGKLLKSAGAYVNFGTVQLNLETTPTLGGVLKGAVEFERGAAAQATLEAELVCQRQTQPRDSNRRSLTYETVRRKQAMLSVQVEAGRRRAPIAFEIPADGYPSGEAEDAGEEDTSSTCRWTLNLKAPNAGGDLERSFELQVLPAGAPAPDPQPLRPAPASAVALIVANLIPLALVFAGWGSVGGLVALYWAENVVIGFYTVLRMLESGRGNAAGKIGQTLFFCAHYGMFCLVHGVFVMTLFLSPDLAAALGLFFSIELLLPLAALAVSHGVSFYLNYIRNGRYLASRPEDSFWRPYPRMVLLHVFILAGGFYLSSRGSPMLPLAGLVIGKTLLDLVLHRRSNR